MYGHQERFLSVKKLKGRLSVNADKGLMSNKPTHGAVANREKRKSDLIHISSSCVSCVRPAVIPKPASYASVAWCNTHDTCVFVLAFGMHISEIKCVVYPGVHPGKALPLWPLYIVI